MDSIPKFVGLHVSKGSIAMVVAERGSGPPRYLRSVSNTPEAVRKVVRRSGQPERLLTCYEAWPANHGLYRPLSGLRGAMRGGRSVASPQSGRTTG